VVRGRVELPTFRFSVGAKAADSQGYLPRSRLVARPPQGARRTGHPACRQGHAGPGQMAVPLPQRGAPAGPPAPGTTRALSKHHHAHLAQPSITAAPRPRPGPAPIGLRTATKNACSEFSKSHRSPSMGGSIVVTFWTAMHADDPVLCD